MVTIFSNVCLNTLIFCMKALWMLPFFVTGLDAASTYTRTSDIAECARTCLLAKSCFSIVYGRLPGVTSQVLCGHSLSHVDASTNTAVDSMKDTRAYFNHQVINSNTPSEHGCQSFIYVPTESSRSLRTPPSLTSGDRCRMLLVGDENSTLLISAQLLCNKRCSCSDLLRISNVWTNSSAANQSDDDVTSACLDAGDSITGSMVTVASAEGGYATLEFQRHAISKAIYNVTVWSFGNLTSLESNSLPLSLSDLIAGDNSSDPELQCYRRPGYSPVCQNYRQSHTAEQTSNQTSPPPPTPSASANGTAEIPYAATAQQANVSPGSGVGGLGGAASTITRDGNETTPASSNNTHGSDVKSKVTSPQGSGPASAAVIGGAVGGALGGVILATLAVYTALKKYRLNKVVPGGTGHALSMTSSSPPAGVTASQSAQATAATGVE